MYFSALHFINFKVFRICVLGLVLQSSKIVAVQDAVAPNCVTDASGSSSCNVGINSVPTLGPLWNGGYQWITNEPVTTTISGVVITETTAIFTATETNFLAASSIVITDASGGVTTTTETQYVSFITAVPSLDGQAAAAVIAGVVIAPALVGVLEGIAIGAAGKSLETITLEISGTFALRGAVLTAGDAQALGKYILAAAAAAIIAGIPLTVRPIITGVTIAPDIITTTDSAEPTVTAIMKPPYENWAQIVLPPGPDPTIPLPDPVTDDLPSSTTSPTTLCTASASGLDPSIVNQMATQFCTGSGIDFSKDASKAVYPSDLTPALSSTSLSSVSFAYSFGSGTCALSCVDSYSSMVKTCQYDSHTMTGTASHSDGCGAYSMKVTPPLQEVTNICADHSTNSPFPRADALDAIGKFCGQAAGITLMDLAVPIIRVLTYSAESLKLSMGWSLSGQKGCAPSTTSVVSEADCNFYFGAAMDNCDTSTTTAKYGSKPLTWNGPLGCIDFNLYGTPPS